MVQPLLLDGLVGGAIEPVGLHLSLPFHLDEAAVLHDVSAALVELVVALLADVDAEGDTVALHPGRRVHGVTKQTVPKNSFFFKSRKKKIFFV